jgi:phosphopantothenoylcysteine decarboxylase / phosphopantothenate---cysteine ligase
MARLLLGVSGGIAAYKAIEVARLAVAAGHAVRVIQTPTSERFVGRASFAATTGAPVLGDEFEPDPARGSYPGEPLPERAPISHLALVERAELYLIAPASANTIAKLAHGIADNLLATAALAAECPVAIAPAMNNRMYRHESTQNNLALLDARGITVIPPGEGQLASHGEYGIGRLAEPAELLSACEGLLGSPSLRGVHVLVTAGGTREPIDSVRYIGNRSSGRMGFALAEQAAHRGAEVTLVAANVGLPAPAGVEVVPVSTAAELAEVCERRFAQCDVLVMAAAVADFRPTDEAKHKIKRGAAEPEPVALTRNSDILAELVSLRREDRLNAVLVGFAAETGDDDGDVLTHGRAKLSRKGCDLLVVNQVGPQLAFGRPDNAAVILGADGSEVDVALGPKAVLAAAVWDAASRILAGNAPGLR